jgi:hypothetical protein
MSTLRHILLVPTALYASSSCYATVYFTLAQVQAVMFAGQTLRPLALTLTDAQRQAIKKMAGVEVRNAELKAWRSDHGEWFLVDQVLGKHEFITYALALAADGTVKQIEVMEYRESYGEQIRNERWRAQFLGKNATAPMTFNRDIKNISGATLSCKHLTDGIRRLLATFELVLRHVH